MNEFLFFWEREYKYLMLGVRCLLAMLPGCFWFLVSKSFSAVWLSVLCLFWTLHFTHYYLESRKKIFQNTLIAYCMTSLFFASVLFFKNFLILNLLYCFLIAFSVYLFQYYQRQAFYSPKLYMVCQSSLIFVGKWITVRENLELNTVAALLVLLSFCFVLKPNFKKEMSSHLMNGYQTLFSYLKLYKKYLSHPSRFHFKQFQKKRSEFYQFLTVLQAQTQVFSAEAHQMEKANPQWTKTEFLGNLELLQHQERIVEIFIHFALTVRFILLESSWHKRRPELHKEARIELGKTFRLVFRMISSQIQFLRSQKGHFHVAQTLVQVQSLLVFIEPFCPDVFGEKNLSCFEPSLFTEAFVQMSNDLHLLKEELLCLSSH